MRMTGLQGSAQENFLLGSRIATHGNQSELPKATQQLSGEAKDPYKLKNSRQKFTVILDFHTWRKT